MASVPTGTVLGSIRRLFGGAGSIVGLGEGELLDRFVCRRDEAAFEAIVARHGPMVLGVCRRVLADSSDVDDAFQATFLVLVKKAAVIRDRDSLGPWLYGVARRVASRARANAARRKAREKAGSRVEFESEASVGPLGEADRREFRALIDEELGALPEKFRNPVILCYLEGLTHDEAASRLGLPVGTVRSRMSWARDRLRTRLSRRGLALPAGAIASTLLSEASAAVVPQALLHATVRSAIAVAAGQGVAAGVVSASVASLTGGILHTMTFHKILGVAAGVLVVGLASGGAVAIGQFGGQGPAAGATQEKTADKVASTPTSEADRLRETYILTKISRADENVRSLEVRIESLKDDLVTTKKERDRLIAELETIRPKSAPVNPPATPAAPAQVSPFVSPAEIEQAEAGVAKTKAALDGARAGVAKAKADLELAEAEAANTRKLVERRMVSQTDVKLSEVRVTRAKAEVAAAEAKVAGAEADLNLAQSTLRRLQRFARQDQDTGAPPATTPGPEAAKVAGEQTLVSNDRLAVTRTADGRTLSVFDKLAKTTKAYQHPEGVTADPVLAGGMVAIIARGETITQIAAYTTTKGDWVVQDLKEPAKGLVATINTLEIAVSKSGRTFYGFSAKTGTWDILEVSEGAPEWPNLNGATAEIAFNGISHVFSAETGRWEPSPESPAKRETFQVRVTPSPDGREVTINDSRDATPKVYRAAEGIRITPMVDGGLVGLIYEGEGISGVAAYSPAKRNWVAQKLAEPFKGTISLDNNTEIVLNYVGRTILAFSGKTGTWDTLQIPDGLPISRPTLDRATASVILKGVLHVFSAETGRWETKPAQELTKKADEPVQHVKSGNLIIGYPADSSFLRVFDPQKNTSKVYRAPEGTKLTPLMGIEIITAIATGAKIPEVAAYSAAKGEWVVQTLREPAVKELSPILSNGYAYCQAGRYFYFFRTGFDANGANAVWSVLELPDASPVAPEFNFNGPSIITGEILHTYNFQTDKWTSINMADPPKIAPTPQPKAKATGGRGGLGQNPGGPAKVGPGGGGFGGFGGPGGGMGGGMGGIGGGTPPKPSKFNRVESASIVAVTSPGKIAAYSTERGTWSGLAIPEDIKATPIIAGDLLAAQLQGPKIERLAVYNAKFAKWDEQGLLEPESGAVNPILGPNLVAYPVGRYVYAYSAPAAAWSVVELSSKNVTPVLGPASIMLDDGDRFLVFSATTGTWAALDDKPGAKSGPPPGAITNNGNWAVGDRFVSIRDARTNSWKTFEVPEGTKVINNFAPMAKLVLPTLEGSKINEVAVYNRRIGRWDVQPLREPASGTVTASASTFGDIAFYRIGRFVFAYSIITSKWDVLELPDPMPDEPVIVGPSYGNETSSGSSEVARLKGKDAVHTFGASIGRWKTTPIEKARP